jgi:hypothetical protein
VKRPATIAAVALAACIIAACGYAAINTLWSEPAHGIVFDTKAPHHVRVLVRQVGTGTYLDYDDTTQFKLTNGVVEHASGWKTIDLTTFGVPTDAKAAILTFKAVLSKGPYQATTAVYAFARAPGADCCEGVSPWQAYPIDYDMAQNGGAGVEGMVAQASGFKMYDTAREWAPSTIVPLVDGRFQFAWGYQRYYPSDALGIGVYLDGWIA